MAKTKIDNEFASLISEIISTQALADYDKEPYRIRTKDTMQIYGKYRAFLSVWRIEAVLSAILIVLAIVFASMGQHVASWVTPLAIGFIGTLVFGILSTVFRSRYRARLQNLSNDFLTKARGKKYVQHSVVPMVCVIGPFINSYRSAVVSIRSEDYDGFIPGYSNLALTFIKNNDGGKFLVNVKNKRGGFSLRPNECGILIGDISKGGIAFQKIPVMVPESAIAEKTKQPKEEQKPAHSDRHCIHCGKPIPSDSVFCTYCGKSQKENVCPKCGASMPDGAMFCPKCGTKKE